MRALAVGLLLLVPLTACAGGDNEDTSARRGPADVATSTTAPTTTGELRVQEYDVPAGSRPHDVAVTDDGIVWYTAQGSGELGRLDPQTPPSRRSLSAPARGPMV